MSKFEQKLTDETYLKTEQYDGASNLQKRINLHTRYSVSEAPWHSWVFSQFDWASVEQVLECGAGSGWLWHQVKAMLPATVSVTLTDLTDGMVAELSKLTAIDDRFSAETADAQSLPFPDNHFDMVIANHMLYHLPDIAKGIAELRRVLRPSGVLYAVTNGQSHLQELDEIRKLFAPSSDYTSPGQRLAFNLENGSEWLSGSFEHVTLKRYQSALEVTDPSAIADYLGSLIELDDQARDSAENTLRQQIDRQGHIHITKAVGMFVAN